jgi:predicted O-methyltransferase YrrM
MKYLGQFEAFIQKPEIFKRYILNVRKPPMKMLNFIMTLTDTQKELVVKYNNEIDVKNLDFDEYRRALYIMTRILEPEIVIETGVFHGYSSFSILSALKENNKGYLHSIDLPSPKLPPGKKPGWVVPENLRSRWDLRFGKSSELLPGLLEEVKEVDIFLHDSEHSYENMSWEYKTAWDSIRKGGLLLSHDVSQNPAFREFAKYVSEKYYYMLRNLAGIKRTKN